MVDYSKWKDIEISDDEDETHPNIDTPSLFRWRHKARVERMEEQKKEREEYLRAKEQNERKLREARRKLQESEKNGVENLTELKCVLKDLEEEAENLRKKDFELQKKEKVTPWNVDTISHSGFSKTVINKAPPRKKDDEESEEERVNKMQEFIKENKENLKRYGMLHKYDDSKLFLQEHPHLVSENTANYLVIWCIDLQVEGKSDLMEHVAHQCICMQYILELSKQLDVDPRACVPSFFSRIQVADPEYKKSFEDELLGFKERVRKRAREKIDEAIREAEEEERKKRLGPGGLDPVEVFESLPPEMKKCFESENIGMLQEVIAKMPEEEACYHMKRCVDSGMWIPDAAKKKDDEGVAGNEESKIEEVADEGDAKKADDSAAR
ncbi:hsp90 co-chaperone Cdc37 [Hetaerina americana]|uniref:hsp90 co-chaperone Cdc37 n=1 Tax=Hetaerina americana TaxID=62018 RepID=UPI003A7F2C0C